MSRSILSLVEQRYRKDLDRALTLAKNKLRAEVKGVPVKFRWRSPSTDKNYLVEGIVIDATLDSDHTCTFTIQFTDPDNPQENKRMTVRKVSEFYE